jgi:flagellar biosynthesis/type III secretory pathway ATPase
MIEDLHNVLKGAQALNNVFAAINVFSSISKIFSDYMSRYTLKFDS